tara:strand:+ start:1030 stop:1767 length:738 start_codon:yes stop_codon:yes gene_type:complete
MESKYILIKGHGPLLITGTHVVNTIRRKNEIHNNESYIYSLIMKLYEILGSNKVTIMLWDKEKIKKTNDLRLEDPNFVSSVVKHSWDKEIKKIKRKRKIEFHIDLHGMKNSSSPKNIDLGIGINFKKRRRLNSKKIKSILIKELKNVDSEIRISKKYSGTGCEMYETITRRTRNMGIFSLQIELSRSIRKKLSKNVGLVKRMANSFLNIQEKTNKLLNKTKKRIQRSKLKTRKCKKFNSKIYKIN